MNRIAFYIYGKTLELNDKQFPLGEVTADLLNLSPEEYKPMARIFEKAEALEKEYEETNAPSVWLELIGLLRELTALLRRYKVFQQLYDCEIDELFAEDEAALKGGEVNGFRWLDFKELTATYRMCLHDVRAFNWTIRSFLREFLSKLERNCPEEYAEAYYAFLNHPTREKLIANPVRNNGDVYAVSDLCAVSYEPLMRDGKAVIAATLEAETLQMILKADFLNALNVGHQVRRCILCGRYFLVKGGAHALYCEGKCPQAPRYTCRQYGTYYMKKERAKDNPKLAARNTALDTVRKHKSRGLITEEQAERAKAFIGKIYWEAGVNPDYSLERFAEEVSADKIYSALGIQRKEKSRGRPPKKGGGAT